MRSIINNEPKIIARPAAATRDAPTAPIYANIEGTEDTDFLEGGDEADRIKGLGGDDGLAGGGGGDTLLGGDGSDSLYGFTFNSAFGDDIDAGDLLNGGGGDDYMFGYAGGDTILGGAGDDVMFGGADSSLAVASDLGDLMKGGLGDDFGRGNFGNDTLEGGVGDDFLFGEQGDDVIDGGKGDDMAGVSLFNATEAALYDASGFTPGDSVISDGYGSTDTLISIEHLAINGSTFDDTLIGSSFGDSLTGNTGADILFGGDGDDTLLGSSGRDKLNGGDGDDVLIGGADADVFKGGAGADTFVSSSTPLANAGRDVIKDLDADDTVDISALDADTATEGDQAFTLVEDFTGVAGEARLVYLEGKDRTVLQMDTNGDGESDQAIVMFGDQTGFEGFVL